MPMRAVLLAAVIVLAPLFAPVSLAREAQMRLPEALAAAPRLPVTGRQGWKRNQRLQFGAVRIFDVDRSLSKGGDLGILFYRGSKRRQRFGFSVAEGEGAVWRGAAATNLRRRTLGEAADGGAIALTDRSGFGAHLAPADAPQDLWVLELSERWERSLRGTLRGAGGVFTVKGTNRLAGTPLPMGETSGYAIEWGSQVLAAVEVINDGAVWIAPDLRPEHRAPLMAAIAALLLFEDLRATLPD